MVDETLDNREWRLATLPVKAEGMDHQTRLPIKPVYVDAKNYKDGTEVMDYLGRWWTKYTIKTCPGYYVPNGSLELFVYDPAEKDSIFLEPHSAMYDDEALRQSAMRVHSSGDGMALSPHTVLVYLGDGEVEFRETKHNAEFARRTFKRNRRPDTNALMNLAHRLVRDVADVENTRTVDQKEKILHG